MQQSLLKDQSAQDIGRYDFLKDIQRLEHVVAIHPNSVGYAVLLTNDGAYWKKPPNHNTIDADFRLYDGRTVEGVLAWDVSASDGTKKGREQALQLRGRYQLRWSGYAYPSSESYGEFRSLVVKISPINEVG